MTQFLKGHLQVLEEEAEAEGIILELPDDLIDRWATIVLTRKLPGFRARQIKTKDYQARRQNI